MRASNRVYPPYFGGHSRDLRSVERFIAIWLASKVICRCRMAVWTGTFPLNPLPLIKVVHDERRDGDRRAGQLHRRGDDSGKRGHGEGGDRYDVHEQHAVHGRDDLVAHIPAQHGDGAGDERHVEELRHDRPSLTAGRNRNVPQLDQHDIDRVHADESEKSRHRRVAVRRPCRKKAHARCVDDPAKSADEERDVDDVALRLIEGAEGIALRYHQDDADKGEQDEADRIERRTNPRITQFTGSARSGIVAVMIAALRAPVGPASCCPRKMRKLKPAKPVVPKSQARRWRSPLRLKAPFPSRAKSRTAKGMAAIVYRMAVKLKGSIWVSADVITGNMQPHETVAM